MEKTKNNWWIIIVALIIGLLIGVLFLSGLFEKKLSMAPNCKDKGGVCDVCCKDIYFNGNYEVTSHVEYCCNFPRPTCEGDKTHSSTEISCTKTTDRINRRNSQKILPSQRQ